MPPPLPEPFRSDQRPVVLIFRGPIFNPSETFVRGHALGLKRYQPLIVGRENKGGIPTLLADRVMIRPAIGLLRSLAPALVHAHFATDGLRAVAVADALGVPLVTSLRGYDVSRSRADLLRSGRLSWMRYALFQRHLMARGDLFLAVSDALRAQAIARGFPAERTLVHYNGVDLVRFRPGADHEAATILHVGRLVAKKGTTVLLRAFAAVLNAHPGARLLILGDGPLRTRLERLAGELGVGQSVIFAGARQPDEIAGFMRDATLLVAPSRTARGGDAEGLPNVVVEAMASGLPVVATDHGGIAEAVAEGENGFLVAEGEAEPLAGRIGDLLADAALRARMGAAGRRIAEREFGAARWSARLEDHYDALIARTRTRAIETR